jgi:hypothetical protein
MNKPEFKFKEEPLRHICNEAFFATKNILFIDSEKYDKALAFLFGLMSGYGMAEVGVQSVNYLGGSEKLLEELAKDGLVGTWSIPLGYYMIAPKYFKQFRQEHPVYSAGTFGVMAGASVRALQELLL